jgi:hypothetical protein
MSPGGVVLLELFGFVRTQGRGENETQHNRRGIVSLTIGRVLCDLISNFIEHVNISMPVILSVAPLTPHRLRLDE